jgi:hypothetical protein
MITIEISGDTVGEIDRAIEALHRPDARTMPLDDLMKITTARFREAGFGVALQQMNPPTTAAEAVIQEASAVLADPEASPEEVENAAEELSRAEEQVVTAEPPKRKRGRPPTTVLKKPAPTAEPEAEESNVVVMTPKPAPDEDRAYVLDTLSARFADVKLKNKTKAFIDRVAGRHGGVRLSRLPPELFPDIRAEMEVYFGGNGHGHAA